MICQVPNAGLDNESGRRLAVKVVDETVAVAAAKDIAMHVAAMNPADVGELLGQPFIKGSGGTVGELVNGVVQKFGERTEIGKFVRFSVN